MPAVHNSCPCGLKDSQLQCKNSNTSPFALIPSVWISYRSMRMHCRRHGHVCILAARNAGPKVHIAVLFRSFHFWLQCGGTMQFIWLEKFCDEIFYDVNLKLFVTCHPSTSLSECPLLKNFWGEPCLQLSKLCFGCELEQNLHMQFMVWDVKMIYAFTAMKSQFSLGCMLWKLLRTCVSLVYTKMHLFKLLCTGTFRVKPFLRIAEIKSNPFLILSTRNCNPFSCI